MNKDRRIPIEFFVSYAHKNKIIADKFIDDLMEVLKPSKKYNYKIWKDSAIIIGGEWKQQIFEARNSCNFGLLLVSPAFIGSEFITNEELPYYVGENRASSIPVMLSKVNFDLYDMKGLEKLQIFRYMGKRYKEPRSYVECINGNPRSEFVFALFEAIESKLAHELA